MVLSKGAHFLLSSSMTVNHDKGIRLYILDILKKSVSVHSPVVKHLSYIYRQLQHLGVHFTQHLSWSKSVENT